jgi:CDP-4-dehydro-6-deoxyglucose reductase, E1
MERQMDRDSALKLIDPIIRDVFKNTIPDDKWIIPLGVVNYGPDEVIEVLDTLLSGNVTMGSKVAQFEQMWAEHVGRKHAIMVNSGSSANLAAIGALSSPRYENGIRPGDEVITTAIPWSTTIAPIVQAGAVPVFVDVDPKSFNIDPKLVKDAISPKSKAIMPVSLLGNPQDMDIIANIAKDNDLLLIEDACEATGSSTNGTRIGTFGEIGTFSFFFSHHISTIEGGMVVTDDDLTADLVRSIRAHGWTRDSDFNSNDLPKNSEIQSKWTFVETGYNLRPTEISGAFGIQQISKLDPIIELRRETARVWSKALGKFDHLVSVSNEQPGDRHSWFGYPLVVRPGAGFERDELATFLKSKSIDVRPIIAGNILEHPVIEQWPHRVSGEVSAASWIHRNGLMIGNHEGITERDRAYFLTSMEEFLSEHGRSSG